MPRRDVEKAEVVEKVLCQKEEHTKVVHRKVERTKARVKVRAKVRRAKYSHDMMRQTREQWTNWLQSQCTSGTMLATHVRAAGCKGAWHGQWDNDDAARYECNCTTWGSIGRMYDLGRTSDKLPLCLTSQRSFLTLGHCAI